MLVTHIERREDMRRPSVVLSAEADRDWCKAIPLLCQRVIF